MIGFYDVLDKDNSPPKFPGSPARFTIRGAAGWHVLRVSFHVGQNCCLFGGRPMEWRSRLYSVRKCCFAVVAAWLSGAVDVRQLWKMNATVPVLAWLRQVLMSWSLVRLASMADMSARRTDARAGSGHPAFARRLQARSGSKRPC